MQNINQPKCIYLFEGLSFFLYLSSLLKILKKLMKLKRLKKLMRLMRLKKLRRLRIRMKSINAES